MQTTADGKRIAFLLPPRRHPFLLKFSGKRITESYFTELLREHTEIHREFSFIFFFLLEGILTCLPKHK
jgi:hypothetical protein